MEECSSDPSDGILRYLIELPEVFEAHSGATLFHHLLGTYRILKSWGYGEELALAGLFHSIYGTPAFSHGPLASSRRNEIGALIGDAAEGLVHAFSLIDWSRLLEDGHEAVRSLPTPLVTLEAGNIVEQWSRVVQMSDDIRAVRRAAERYLLLVPSLESTPALRLSRELHETLMER